ncbi:hypothetical protein JHS3_22160 [Jeongeupia sp. HS-3]|uniref:hypothetical protein n=1 Tax=Jeongeupia sp. HS-3 TaxID=1009682 RepID=UPI0018A4264F|nr:hypothetical protein [Jeongeupia sp. HS-3]BCL76480.1 hypothetical protein JHS3_22160 [Jeongeupia sp. HS-3]
MNATWPLLYVSLLPLAAAADVAVITNTGANGQGVLSINQAAGNVNAAANLRSLTMNSDGAAMAQAVGTVVNVAVQAGGGGNVPQARIEGTSFSGFNGVLGINQQAGQQNAVGNTLAIAVGTTAQASAGLIVVRGADDALLSGQGGQAALEQLAAPGLPQTSIDPAAFRGGRGVVQVNQVAGNGNVAGNALAVQFSRPPG